MAELVLVSGLPRRQVEDTLAELKAQRQAIRGRQVIALDQDSREVAAREIDEYRDYLRNVKSASSPDLLAEIRQIVADVPKPKANLDHVQATAETVFKRGQMLATEFYLKSRSILFLGDHDLTSICLKMISPSTRVVVSDIDDDLLNFLSEWNHSNADSPGYDTYFSDFRYGFPPALVDSVDVVFSDPPYTQDGLQLFVRRALTALTGNPQTCRMVLAYGHSRLRPDTGIAAQSVLSKSGLSIDAMLPGFNSYHGAEALGSRADLYICQPSAKALKSSDKVTAVRAIYTHGSSSVETANDDVTRIKIGSEGRILSEIPEGNRIAVVLDDNTKIDSTRISTNIQFVRMDTVVTKGLAVNSDYLIITIRSDFAYEKVFRAVLSSAAVRFSQVTVIQKALTRDDVSVLQQTKTKRYLELAAMDVTEDYFDEKLLARITVLRPSAEVHQIWRYILSRPHGRLQNVTREALIDASGDSISRLTKRDATDILKNSKIAEIFAAGQRLIDLPIREILRLKTEIERIIISNQLSGSR